MEQAAAAANAYGMCHGQEVSAESIVSKLNTPARMQVYTLQRSQFLPYMRLTLHYYKLRLTRVRALCPMSYSMCVRRNGISSSMSFVLRSF